MTIIFEGFNRVYHSTLKDLIENRKSALYDGVKDWNDYQRIRGELRAYQHALDIHVDMVNNMEQQNDR
jgi:hypothetical protein